jgi:TonB family protein
MTRLEKKCLLASTGAHGVLAALLLVTPLMVASKRQEFITMPVLTFIPSRLVDGAMGGGGSPDAKTLPNPPKADLKQPLVLAPPPTAPAQESAPPKEEAKPTPKDPEPSPKARPKKSGEPVPAKSAKTETTQEGEGKRKKKIEISLERDSGPSKAELETQARAKALADARAAQARFKSGLNQVLGAISQGVSSGTVVDIPGPGGEAYADYGQWVVAVYHRAWTPPSNLADEQATVTARVVILRDGTVESFKVIQGSGHPALDRSVERLRNVDHIARFPEGAPDEKRTFIIDFNLRSKRA